MDVYRYSKGSISYHKALAIPLLIASVFPITRQCNQCRCPSTEEWIGKNVEQMPSRVLLSWKEKNDLGNFQEMGGSGKYCVTGVIWTERQRLRVLSYIDVGSIHPCKGGQRLRVLSYADAGSIHPCKCGQRLKLEQDSRVKELKECLRVGAKGHIDMKLERRLMEEDTGWGDDGVEWEENKLKHILAGNAIMGPDTQCAH